MDVHVNDGPGNVHQVTFAATLRGNAPMVGKTEQRTPRSENDPLRKVAIYEGRQ